MYSLPDLRTNAVEKGAHYYVGASIMPMYVPAFSFFLKHVYLLRRVDDDDEGNSWRLFPSHYYISECSSNKLNISIKNLVSIKKIERKKGIPWTQTRIWARFLHHRLP
jgi:hypothetical protein